MLIHRLKGNASLGHAKISWAETKATLTDWRLYLHYLAFISISVPFSSISLFAPTIVAGLGYQGLNAQLFTVPPFAIGFLVTVLVSRLADKYKSWSLGSTASLMTAGLSFLVQGKHHSASWRVNALILNCRNVIYRRRITTNFIQSAICDALHRD